MIACIYARYSSENQSEESITAQIRAATEYAIREGHTIVEHYIDRAMTARSDRRPEFQRMISDAKTGKFQAVIVHKLDRFSRDRMDSALYRQKLEKNNVRLISVLEKLDDSPESALMTGVIESVNEFYSKNLARETRKGLREIALQAKTTGGSMLYGYELDEEGHYRINEAQAQVIRRVFDACINRTGYNKLIEEFRAEGIRTQRGNEIGKNTMYYWIKNPRYKGTYIYSPEGERKYAKSKLISIENGMPAIVSPETWDKANNIMKQRKTTGRKPVKKTYLLSGILYCGLCGKPMYGHAQRKKNGYEFYAYECSSRMSNKKSCTMPSAHGERLETAIINYLKELLKPSSISNIRNYLLEHMELINGKMDEECKAYEAELNKLRKQSDRAIDLLFEGDLPKEAIKRKLDQFETRIAVVESKIMQLRAQKITPEQIDENLQICIQIDGLTDKEKQQIISKIIKKITVSTNGDGDKVVTIINIFNAYLNCHGMIGGATPNTIIL